MSLAKDKPYYAEPSDYEDDVSSWAFEQAQLLRLGRLREVDLPNVIEEIESLGNEQLHALESFYSLLIMHLLKWQFQPERRSRSWQLTILNSRNQIKRRERRNAKLRAGAGSIVADIYFEAVEEAATETGIPVSRFPNPCPYTIEDLRRQDFLPE